MHFTNKAPTNKQECVCGFYFLYNPGVAETLDMHDEGETLGFLEKKCVSPSLRIQ